MVSGRLSSVLNDFFLVLISMLVLLSLKVLLIYHLFASSVLSAEKVDLVGRLKKY
jgi:hypothetical protein